MITNEPPHIARVLNALDAQGSTARATGPAEWTSACPCCGREMTITDISWNEDDSERRAHLYCRGCREETITERIGVRHLELFLSTAASNNGRAPGEEEQNADWLAGAPMDPIAVSLEPLPTIPGFPFLHAGVAANIAGPTGGGRSSLIEACLYDAARSAIRCLYLGDEVTQDEFNARAAEIARERGDTIDDELRAMLANCRYLDLPTAIAHAYQQPEQWKLAVTAHGYRVVAIDPLSSAADALGLNFNNDGPEYLEFYGKVIQPLRAAGIAIVCLDNIGFAEGAQKRSKGVSEKGHKADLTFWCKNIEDPTGLLLIADKVRPSRCAHKRGDRWQILKTHQRLERISANQPEEKPPFRPTTLMERVSQHVQANPGVTRNAVRDDVTGKGPWVIAALQILVDENYVRRKEHGQAHKHYSVRPFREADDPGPPDPPKPPTGSTGSQPGPNRVPDPVGRTGSTGSLPLQGDPDPGPGPQDPPSQQPGPSSRAAAE